MRTIYICFCLLMLSALLKGSRVMAQTQLSKDTTYIKSFPDQLVTRLYFSRKYTGFHVNYDALNDQILKYEPNTTRNLGIGASYNWITLNLAYGFDIINQNEEQGSTKYLDLQSHLYLGKFNVDLFGQFYRGYYLKNLEPPGGGTYLRPDLNAVELGASVQYVFNHEKYSFKAAFQNTEYQKKSAGSWILGWDVFYGNVTADSSLVPGFSNAETPDFDRLRFFKTGPLGGFAYTLVIARNYYLTGSLFLAVNGGVYSLKSNDQNPHEFYITLDYGLKVAAGYNSDRWNVGGLFVFQEIQAERNYKNQLNTGNLRFIVAYRLKQFDKKQR